MRFIATVFAATVAVLPFAAQAHQYWVEPNEFFFYQQTRAMDAKVTEQLTFEFTGGDTYFNADTNRANASKEYTVLITQPDGMQLKPAALFDGKTRMVAEAEVAQTGTHLLAVSRTGAPMYSCKLKDESWVSKPRDELTPAEAKDAQCGGYFQHTKAYVTLHAPTAAWEKPAGHALEIVPLSHPGTVFTGDTLKVKLLAGGKPLADTKIVGIYQGFRAQKHGDTPISVTTDKDGVAALTFDRASRWLITTKQETPAPDAKKAEKIMHQASLMLEVNEPWVREWLKPVVPK